MAETSTKPYLIRAIYEWCADNGYTPYLGVAVDRRTRVPRQHVKNGEIVMNVSPLATNRLELGNEFISFQARFGGVAQDIVIPVDNVSAIYARETGHGMAFEVSLAPDEVDASEIGPDAVAADLSSGEAAVAGEPGAQAEPPPDAASRGGEVIAFRPAGGPRRGRTAPRRASAVKTPEGEPSAASTEAPASAPTVPAEPPVSTAAPASISGPAAADDPPAAGDPSGGGDGNDNGGGGGRPARGGRSRLTRVK